MRSARFLSIKKKIKKKSEEVISTTLNADPTGKVFQLCRAAHRKGPNLNNQKKKKKKFDSINSFGALQS